MKKTVRWISLLLCLASLLTFASCRDLDDSLPKGMMLACAVGADYRLYVPTSWNLNTGYGVSGAFRDLSHQSTVSVQKYALTEAMKAEMEAVPVGEDATARLEWFLDTQCLPTVRAQALNGEVPAAEEAAPAVLDGVNARRWHFTALINGTTLHLIYVIAEKNEAFYVFSFISDTDFYEICLSDVERMLEEFIFAEPFESLDYARKIPEKDENTPEGMKPAYTNDVAYRFYVPDDWTVDPDQEIYAAYEPNDRASVSVTPYFPMQDGMSPDDYFAMTRELMEKTAGAGGFVLLDSANADLGGRHGMVYEYTYRVGMETYHYRQYVVAYKSMIYTLTYTATEAAYPNHLDAVEAIVAAFSFR